MPQSDSPPAGLRRNSGYLRLLGASTVTNLGDGMSSIAYPWLASGLTRQPFLIALVAVVQRLPWLVLTLPAGVITDRVDRKRLIVRMDVIRGLLTVVIGIAVFMRSGLLPHPGEVTTSTSTDAVLYVVVLLTSLLMGSAEVLRDNSAQTLMPSVVAQDDLEAANGRMWAVESATNQFIGPPIGSLLLGIGFAVPFFIDASTFLVSAALIATIPGCFEPPKVADERPHWKVDLVEGVRWLRSNKVLWPMALVLGAMNGSGALAESTMVIFAQEVIGAGPFLFAVIGTGGAIGAIVGGWFVPRVTKRLGGGTVLLISVAGIMVCLLAPGFTTSWVVLAISFALSSMFGLAWNVVTVSLRQSVIPNHFLGRVNSVYRFLAWGSIPIGAALGGLVVTALDGPFSRTVALRAPWVIGAALHLLLLVVVIRRLSTKQLDELRVSAAVAK